MRVFKILAVLILVLLTSSAGFALDERTIIKKVQGLLKDRDYAAAKELLQRQIKINRTSYKLWMTLGYVFEADNDFRQALAAFEQAAQMKIGIEGIEAKINRMREMTKIQPAGDDLTDAEKLMYKARVLDSQNKNLEACQTFVDAVELDRSILSRDFGFIEKGLKYFQKNSGLPEQKFYLGAFYFFSGQYSLAEGILNDYISENAEGAKVPLAKKYIEESKDIVAQLILASAPVQPDVASAGVTATGSAVAIIDQKVELPLETPTWEPQETPSSDPAGDTEPIEVTYARQKAIQLLNDYDSEDDEEKKLGMIWQIGLLRLPFPEVMTSFATFLGTDNVDTIFATIEALEKINLPGAQTCSRHLYNLLDHKNEIISFRAIKAFSRLPMDADKIVPRLFRIYQQQRISIRKQAVVNALKAYNQESIAILNSMIKAAEGVNKRPIAEVLSILTGKDTEAIINES